MQGKIIKGIAGFYYVQVQEAGIYECRAKGIFRKDGIRPLVGDDVVLTVLEEKEKTGNIEEILPRKNELIRPAVANIDQALIIFALKQPKPNFHLLDSFLVGMERQDVPTIICFNKLDKVPAEECEKIKRIYRNCGSRLLFASAKTGEGLEELREILRGKTTTVAGPSGVGKSSLVNRLTDAGMETGDVSKKTDRGRHTTRHSEILWVEKDTYICDTPGFSAFFVRDMEPETLKDYFPEFYPYEGQCRFLGCTHTHEPECPVKEKVNAGEISRERYESYCGMYAELKEQRKY